MWQFWATVKSLFSNKIKSVENIVFSENGVLKTDEEILVNIFNNFFVNIIPNLGKRLNMNSLTPLIINKIQSKMLFENMRITPVLF